MKLTFMNVLSTNKVHFAVLIFIFLFSLLIRLPYLSQPMRHDEALTFIEYASTPLTNAISNYRQPNNHVFHTLLVHLAYSVLGNEPWVIRLPAFLAGLLITPAIYGVTRLFYNQYAALLAAGMTAVSLSLIEFSTNARGYTLITLIFVIQLGLAKRLKQNPPRRYWWLFGLLAALGLYTIPVMVYPLGIVSLWLLLSIIRETTGEERRLLLGRLVRSLILGAILTVLFYLPVIRASGLDSLVNNEFVTKPEVSVFYSQLGRIFIDMWIFPNRGFQPIMAPLLALGVVISLLFRTRLSSDRVPVSLAACLWIVPLLLFQRVIPFDRTWIFLTPLYLMLAAAGWAFLVARSRWLFYASTVMLTVLLGLHIIQSGEVYQSEQTGNMPDAEAIALDLHSRIKPGDIVLAPIPLDAPVRYYLNYYGFSSDSIFDEFQITASDMTTANTILVLKDQTQDTVDFNKTFGLSTYGTTLEPIRTFSRVTLEQLAFQPWPPNTLFREDFEGPLSEGLVFKALEGQIVEDAGSRILDIATANDWGDIILLHGDDWADYALEVKVNILQPSTEVEDMYLYLRHRFEIGNYIASINTTQNRVNLSGDIAGEWRGFLSESSFDLTPGQWYTIRLQAVADQIVLYIDGAAVTTIQDDAIQQGTIRIMIPPNMRLLLDDITVTDLSSSARN